MNGRVIFISLIVVYKNILDIEKNLKESEFLNFPVLQLAKEKFGGSTSKIIAMDSKTSDALLESLKPQIQNE